MGVPTASEADIRSRDFSFLVSLSNKNGPVDIFGASDGLEIHISISEDGLPDGASFHWPNIGNEAMIIFGDDGAPIGEEMYEVLAYELLDSDPKLLGRLTQSEPEETPAFG
jgi:hypothetical protein